MDVYPKEQFIKKLRHVRATGWVANARPGNAGGVGNTLEDLLGIQENNLPIPNAAEWELKCQRASTTSLTTLFHMEPSPRALKFVPNIFLPKYGWRHKTLAREMSFRQTISGHACSDRGFKVLVERRNKKVRISFDAAWVDPKHKQWLKAVKSRIGLAELNPQPYWGFDDLHHKAGTKLLNCFYVQAQVKQQAGKEWFLYEKIFLLQGFNFNMFLRGIERGYVYIDFDARTRHNHGTKFRLKQDKLPTLYSTHGEI